MIHLGVNIDHVATIRQARRTIEPDPVSVAVYGELYSLYKKLYFGFGQPRASAVTVGEVLPALRRVAAMARVEH